jgi:nucleotide-binding universal stress UspA family protein
VREIVVGVDGSQASVAAAALAGRLASESGAHLMVVHVRTVPPGRLGPPLLTPGQLSAHFERVEAQARSQVEAALGPVDVSWSWRVVDGGDPAEELERVAAAVGADMVVVGCRGQSAVGRVLLGSVSTRLAHHADRPVLVAR